MNRLSNNVGPSSGSILLYQTVVKIPVSVRRALDCLIMQFDFVTCSLTVCFFSVNQLKKTSRKLSRLSWRCLLYKRLQIKAVLKETVES